MKGSVDHILRPRLPWRPEATVTECGLEASTVKTISRPEFFQREKEYGTQRNAILTCMTCLETARRWGKAEWSQDPRLAMGREIEWEWGSSYWRARDDRGQRLKDELLAIAGLIEAHRDEFEMAVAAIDARRQWNERKQKVTVLKSLKPKGPKPL